VFEVKRHPHEPVLLIVVGHHFGAVAFGKGEAGRRHGAHGKLRRRTKAAIASLRQGLDGRVAPAANDEIGDLPPIGARIGQPLIMMRVGGEHRVRVKPARLVLYQTYILLGGSKPKTGIYWEWKCLI